MNGIIAQLLTERLKIHLVLDFTRMASTNNNLSPVIHDLLDLLSTNPQTSADSLAIPVAAIHSLLRVIDRSTSKTMQGLNAELREATAEMLSHANR